MGFRECLLSAADQGVITRDQAEELNKRFERKRAKARAAMPEDVAAATAKQALADELRAASTEAKRLTVLQESAKNRLWDYFKTYRNTSGKADIFAAVLNKFEHYGTGDTTSVSGRAKAIVDLAHAEMQGVIRTFRRSRLTGRRLNRPAMADVVKEMFGEASGSAEAKAMADAISGVFEKLRQRFNVAGGAIGKLEGFGLPQAHDGAAVLAATREGWKDFIRPLLDRSKMLDPLTGERLSADNLEAVLDHVWDTIATDGMNTLEPTMQRKGLGALASQRAEHRFLHFEDADAWLKYAREFGNTDPIKTAFDHVNGMARDIAAMEELGPNPSASVEWMKQLVQREAANKIRGEASLYAGGKLGKIQDQLGYIPYRIESVWQAVRGGAVVSSRMAARFANLRNVLTSAQLGGAAVLAATTDPFFDAFARHLSGLPILKSFGVILKTYSEATAGKAVSAGLAMDDFAHSLADGARYAGIANGSEWSKWLVDRTMQLSALEPMTQSRKHLFGLEFMGALASHADRELDQIDPVLRRWFDGYGLDAAHWDSIRSTPLFKTGPNDVGLLRPADVAQHDREAAERMLMMINGQTERAVPTGTARSRAYATGGAVKGTVAGELLQSFLQYKSFGLSLTTLQLQAIAMELGLSKARGIGYAATLGLVMTLGGAIGMQLRAIASGKDPQPMNNPKFWMAAAQVGGGFGIFGDFLFSDQSRYGQSFTETMAGPVLGLATDLIREGYGGAQKEVLGGSESGGRDLVGLAGRYTPVLSSLWYGRLAYRRVILDQLQYLVDPKAHARFRDQEHRAQRDTGQAFWWRPGEASPGRLPSMSGLPE